jgi:hypothetical protein
LESLFQWLYQSRLIISGANIRPAAGYPPPAVLLPAGVAAGLNFYLFLQRLL